MHADSAGWFAVSGRLPAEVQSWLKMAAARDRANVKPQQMFAFST
jgi:hypothetical protein